MAVTITWTKEWSASDDGTVFGGADLKNLQDDIEGHTHTDISSTFDGLTDVNMTSAAQGDVIYYNGTNYVNLGYGTSGQVLQTQGSGANPQWVDAKVMADSGDSTAGYLSDKVDDETVKVNASDNLESKIIDNRTSDPGTPDTGQIWLRTDV